MHDPLAVIRAPTPCCFKHGNESTEFTLSQIQDAIINSLGVCPLDFRGSAVFAETNLHQPYGDSTTGESRLRDFSSGLPGREFPVRLTKDDGTT